MRDGGQGELQSLAPEPAQTDPHTHASCMPCPTLIPPDHGRCLFAAQVTRKRGRAHPVRAGLCFRCVRCVLLGAEGLCGSSRCGRDARRSRACVLQGAHCAHTRARGGERPALYIHRQVTQRSAGRVDLDPKLNVAEKRSFRCPCLARC